MINVNFGNILRKDFRGDCNHFEQDVVDKLLELKENKQLLTDKDAVIELDAKDYGLNKTNVIKFYKLAEELDVNLDIVDGKMKIFYNQPFDWTASNKRSALVNRCLELTGQLAYTAGFFVFALVFLIVVAVAILPMTAPKSLLMGLSVLLIISCWLIIGGFLVIVVTGIIRMFMLKKRALKEKGKK